MNFNILRSQEEQIQAIATQLESLVSKFLKEKDQVVIAVSGGKSPIKLFERLSNTDLPWDKILITLVDERVVDTENEDSNENLVKTHLLKNYAKKAKFVGLVDIIKSVTDMLQLANTNIPNIDIAILGMGEDGHTASIFPCCQELDDAINLDNKNKYINTNPLFVKYSRISLTLPALFSIPSLILSINSEIKFKVFNESLKANNKSYPISYLLNLRNDLITFYYE
ncbi:MAG: 6-phosphogluconolactonase [Neisseriaceae bacterium]